MRLIKKFKSYVSLNSRKRGIVLALSLSFLVFALPFAASAAGVIPTNPLSSMSEAINWGAGQLVGGLNSLFVFLIKLLGTLLDVGAQLLEYVLRLGRPGEAAFVKVGWEIIRDVANLFFVIILVFIGIATILDIEALQKYTAKRTLPRLIAAALLINFSLVIAGFIINAADLLSASMLNTATREDGKISEGLANGLRLTEVFEVDPSSSDPDAQNTLAAAADKSSLQKNIIIATNSAMAAVFIGIAVAVIWLGALMFVARYVALWFLLILAPAAWILAILPNTQQWWGKWWNQFIRWTLFAPIFIFFIMLAALIGRSGALQTEALAGIQRISPEFGPGLLNVFVTNFNSLLSYLLLLGILVGGMYIGMSFGGYGAQAVKAGAQRSGRWAGRQFTRGGRKAGGAAVRAGRRAAQKRLIEEEKRAKKKGGAPAAKLKTRAARTLLGGKKRAAAAMEEKKDKIKNQREQIKGFLTSDLERMLAKTVRPPRKAAILQELAARKSLSGLDESYEESGQVKTNWADVVEKAGGDRSEIEKVRPDLASDIVKAVQKLGKDIATSVEPAALQKKEVLDALNKEQAQILAANPGTAKEITNQFAQLSKVNQDAFVRKLESIRGFNFDKEDEFEYERGQTPHTIKVKGSKSGQTIVINTSEGTISRGQKVAPPAEGGTIKIAGGSPKPEPKTSEEQAAEQRRKEEREAGNKLS